MNACARCGNGPGEWASFEAGVGPVCSSCHGWEQGQSFAPFAWMDQKLPEPVEEDAPVVWRLGFGPFDGQKVSEAPTKYLRWLLGSGTVGNEEKRAIAAELIGRPQDER